MRVCLTFCLVVNGKEIRHTTANDQNGDLSPVDSAASSIDSGRSSTALYESPKVWK